MIDPRAFKGHETGDTVKKHYCQHCQERIVLRQGVWRRLASNPLCNSWDCAATGLSHTPR